MKRILYLTLVLLGAWLNSPAQWICVPDSQFAYPRIPQRADISASFRVTFDVIGRWPSNIRIGSLDHWLNMIPEFDSAIRHNLENLYFGRDSESVSVKMIFELRPPGTLSSVYAYLHSQDEIHIVAPQVQFEWEGDPWPIAVDLMSDSITLKGFVPFHGGVPASSDILVERLFRGTTDSTLIIRNNCPTYVQAIREAASQFTREEFLRYHPTAKRYFVRFRIFHHSRECRIGEIL